MGKTLTSLLTIGAAIAVNAIPGVGQVISGAIVGGLGGTFAAVGVASTVLGVLSTGLTVAALSSAAGLLGLTPGAPKSDTASTSVKTSRPPRVSAYGAMRLYGAYILYETGNNGAAIDGYAVHDGMMTAPIAFYIGDDKVTWKSGVSYPGGLINGLDDGKMGDDTTRFYYTDGRTPGTVIPVIVNDLPGVWSNNHRGDGVCLIYTRFASVKSKNFAKRYPFGQPPPASIAAQWQKCPDAYAANPLDQSQWTWTENVVRHLLHYKIVRENVDYATKIAPTIAFWRAAQSVADEAVPLKAGGTETRYRSCISHQHTQRHADVISTMLTACDGWLATRQDGALVIYAGKYYAPTISIGPEHIVSYEWNGVGVDDDDAVNELVCSYISADHDYNSVETTAWRDEDDIAERGQILSNNLDIQTPSWGQVRRLAKRQMARTNALYRGTVTTNVAGRIARGQRYINLRLAEAGTTFYNGPAEITAVTRNMETGGVTFSWVAADPNIDAWNPATEEGEPAALGDRVASEPLVTPVIDTAVAELGNDGSSARIRVTADGFDRDDITWYLRWRVTTDGGAWVELEYTDIDPGLMVQLLTDVVPTDVSIDVAIAYGVGDGRISDWSPTVMVSTSTAGLAPSPPYNFTVSGGTGQTYANWTNPTSVGFADTQLFRNTSDDYGTATLVTTQTGMPGDPMFYNDTGLSAGTYYYFIIARNGAGTSSAPIASGAVTVV